MDFEESFHPLESQAPDAYTEAVEAYCHGILRQHWNERLINKIFGRALQSHAAGRMVVQHFQWQREGAPRPTLALLQRQAGSGGRTLATFFAVLRLAGIALLVLLLPVALRVVSYFLLMPVVSRVHKPIQLAAGSESTSADLRAGEVQRTLTIELGEDEVLSARSEHVRPVQGKIRSQLLYEWASPFISFASGLHSLSRITGDEGVTSAVLSAPDAPDSSWSRPPAPTTTSTFRS